MDTERTCQRLTQEQIRYLILEADRDAERLKADKYREILETITGEKSPEAAESQAAPALQVARDDALPTLDPPLVELTITQRLSANPSVVGRKRNSSIASADSANPAQISKRARLDRNIPTANTSTSEPYSPPVRRSAKAPVLDVARILGNAGLTSLELTRAEATCVEETPGIGFAGYKDFFCVDVIVQPFAPRAAGKPGLLLRPPSVIEKSETEKDTIHVLSNAPQSDTLYYLGKYTRVPVPETHFDWFAHDLPSDFQSRWAKRITSSRKPAIRAICARIQLRNRHGREPSAKEVTAHLRRFDNDVTCKEVTAAFRSGEEKMVLEGLRCTGYDSCLATIIQRTVGADDG